MKANLVTVIVFISLLFGLAITDMLHKPGEISILERRTLAQPPEFSMELILDGSFSRDYASFLKDQVVFRNGFRNIKALLELRLFWKGEINDVYVIDDDIYDQFYGINQHLIERDANLIEAIIEMIESEMVYLAVVPSKAHMLDDDRFLLSDQSTIADYLRQNTTASYIDIMDFFDDVPEHPYYRTDHHWTTQGAIEAYALLATAMGYEPIEDYSFEEATGSFVGSSYGRAALMSLELDTIHLAHNDYLDSMSVCRYQTANSFECFNSIYYRGHVDGLDPYDVFLGGAAPIIVIENDRGTSDQELVLFKDSYSHVLAPFLAQHFQRVTLIDLRYVRKELILERFDLNQSTTLFIFSTIILNSVPQILN